MQKNLEQIRALHAHRFWDTSWRTEQQAQQPLKEVRGAEGGNIVAKLGPMILECGLLATLAFAKQKGGGYEALMKEVGRYLGDQGANGRHLLPAPAENLDAFIRQLTDNDSSLLRLATAEAMLYAGYLKRFAPPKEKPPRLAAPLPNPIPIEAPYAG